MSEKEPKNNEINQAADNDLLRERISLEIDEKVKEVSLTNDEWREVLIVLGSYDNKMTGHLLEYGDDVDNPERKSIAERKEEISQIYKKIEKQSGVGHY